MIVLGACPRGITDSGYVLTVAPGGANLFVSDTAHFTATLIDKDGAVVSTPFDWSVDDPSIATIDAGGTAHALAAGTTTVRASAKGEVGTAPLVVVADSGHSLTVSPTSAQLFVTSAEQLTATLADRNGNPLSAHMDWQSSNAAVATVDGNGLVHAVAIGSASIQVTARGLSAATAITVSAQPAAVTLVGAGDIASCLTSSDEATAKLLDGISGTVFTAGDNAYAHGATGDFAGCYAPTWGRHKGRTHPAPGNHEYDTPGAPGYFGYFGAAAGDPTRGYYSYDLGGWHVVMLNSNVDASATSAQLSWLRDDLAAHQRRCTLAIWHHPRFSSGKHGSSAAMQPLYQVLYDANADLVVVGHDHIYERFAPQTPAGQVDQARGIREFVVGTGGGEDLYPFDHPAANSEVKNNETYGVLKLTLYGDRYDWKFVPVAGKTFTDSGSGSCH